MGLTASSELQGCIDILCPTRVAGWAWDRRDPSRRLIVVIHHDSTCIEVQAASLRNDLKEAGLGDGQYSFDIAISAKDVDNVRITIKGSDFLIPVSKEARICKETRNEGIKPQSAHIIRLDDSTSVEFTAHNICLDDGSFTKPGDQFTSDTHPWFVAAKNLLGIIFPGHKGSVRLADLGCLEGGYAVEFARLGYDVLGIEVRESNFAACNYVKSKVDLPNLNFVRDDAWNIRNYGIFDVIFCSGLLYHLDRPKKFVDLLSSVAKKAVIMQTHFAVEGMDLSENEGIQGSWYTEFDEASHKSQQRREAAKWSSWDNRRSFLIQREYLIQTIKDAGFDVVIEQFDGLGPNIAESMLRGYYRTDRRGTFIGIRL